MKQFMDADFLLSTDTAKTLYHNYAKVMPIVDYHCHISPKEIYEDRKFKNITELWLEADHYKWRQMRSNGVEEKYITGNATDKEKFIKWASTLEMAIGNPLYHWSHLELKRYFGYEGVLNESTVETVWELCNQKLKKDDMSARNLILKSNVKLLCTTDDPADDLKWHKLLAEENSFPVKVLPAFRPDLAMYIERDEYTDYLNRLSKAADMVIDSFESLIKALCKRMDFFDEMGCKTADHGLLYVMYQKATFEEIELIFQKRMEKCALSVQEEMQFKTAFLLAMGEEYCKRGWVMQLHYGVKRDNAKRIYQMVGADAGIDCISNDTPTSQLADFLNALDEKDMLPKTVLYSLNPTDNAAIGTVIGCFQNSLAIGKIQQGSAWWFNDHKMGMTEQMTSLASLGLLGNFIGMLTDSRSLVSYTRHEYFRRILCELVGNWVENGEYPQDFNMLSKIIRGICYDNVVRYFEFDI